MSTSSLAVAAQPDVKFPGGNKFSFQDSTGVTQITFFPTAPGPLIKDRVTGGPSLSYTDFDQTRIFRDTDIQIQSSPFGAMITVILQPVDDNGGQTFTLVLPPVTRSDNRDPISFSTIGILADTAASDPAPGSQITSSVLNLQGTAESVFMPL